MKVLFSNPPWWIENPDGIYTPRLLAGVRAGSRWPFTTTVQSRPGHYIWGDYTPYPFFMGAAATYLARETGADVAFRDSIALREGYPVFMSYLEEQNFDYIFIESASPSWEHDAKLIGDIKRQHPQCKIVVTGPIAVMGERLLAEHPLEAVIQGEYEKGGVRVVGGGEQGLIGYDLLTEAELNAAPYPYFDEHHAHRYWDDNPQGQISPQLQVLSSRGCPFKCIFCVWPAVMTNNDPDGTGKRVVRQYGADYMEGLLTEMVGRYGFKSVYFDDDTFNLGDRHVREMCAVMQRVGLPWSAMCRADTISRDTWKLMRDSGCFGVKIGFESGNQWVIDNIIHKNLDLAKAREVVLHLKELGFTIHGTFTVGLPGESEEQMAETTSFRKSLPLDTFQESGTAEIEGSPLSTLRKTGHLANYSGAVLDGYTGDNDGTRKLRRVALRELTLEHALHLRATGNPALAEAVCVNLIESGEPKAPLLDFLGVLAAEAGLYNLALRHFTRAITADPLCYDAVIHLGDLLRQQNIIEAAAACYRQALEIDPGGLEAKEALEALEAALKQDATPEDDAESLLGPAGVRCQTPESEWGRNLQTVLENEGVIRSSNGPAAAPTVSGRPPRVLVLDHGMRFTGGHHFAYNRGLFLECHRRGMPIEIYVHAECLPEAADMIHAKRVLMPSQYVGYSQDRQCKYLEDFNIASRVTEANLHKNLDSVIEATDIVYVHTAHPNIVMGIAAWYAALPPEKQPYLCLKFQNHCYRYVMEEYKALVLSVFRLALKTFQHMEKVRLAASNDLIRQQIEAVAEKPCQVFPIPLQLEVAPKPFRRHAEKRTLYIGYAGEGRKEQGIPFLPQVIEAVTSRHEDVKFVVQLACQFTTDEVLAQLASFGDKVILHQECLVGTDFHKLLTSFDALLLPYQPEKYIERSSQVVIEGIALGVPLIIPQWTSLSYEAETFECGHTLIQAWEPGAIVAAIEEFITFHDEIAYKSSRAAQTCAQFHCGPTLLDMLLDTETPTTFQEEPALHAEHQTIAMPTHANEQPKARGGFRATQTPGTGRSTTMP